jgi:ADP-ribosylglycohydrolase
MRPTQPPFAAAAGDAGLSAAPADRLARALLSLDGLSIGDAFGERFLHLPREAPDRIAARLPAPPPWPWTDDTQMAMALLEVLARHGAVEQDELATCFAGRMESHRGYGAAAFELLLQLQAGERWDRAAAALFHGQGSLGNGAAMRVAPLGAYFADDLDRVAHEAARSAAVTHAHPDGIAGAIAVAIAAALAVRSRGSGLDAGPYLAAVAARTPPGATRDGVERASRLPPPTRPPDAVVALGNGSRITAADTVPFALWSAARHADDVADALWTTASGLGDIDTTCAIVGGIVALRTGAAGIPDGWRAAREPLPPLPPLPPPRP